jgi:hypothetical protein
MSSVCPVVSWSDRRRRVVVYRSSEKVDTPPTRYISCRPTRRRFPANNILLPTDFNDLPWRRQVWKKYIVPPPPSLRYMSSFLPKDDIHLSHHHFHTPPLSMLKPRLPLPTRRARLPPRMRIRHMFLHQLQRPILRIPHLLSYPLFQLLIFSRNLFLFC